MISFEFSKLCKNSFIKSFKVVKAPPKNARKIFFKNTFIIVLDQSHCYLDNNSANSYICVNYKLFLLFFFILPWFKVDKSRNTCCSISKNSTVNLPWRTYPNASNVFLFSWFVTSFQNCSRGKYFLIVFFLFL